MAMRCIYNNLIRQGSPPYHREINSSNEGLSSKSPPFILAEPLSFPCNIISLKNSTEYTQYIITIIDE